MTVAAPTSRRLAVFAAGCDLAALAELVEAWRGVGVTVDTDTHAGAAPEVAALVAEASTPYDAVLLVSSARRAPSTAVPSPLATSRGGRRIPVGWLPASGGARLRQFAAAAARVQRRGGAARALALLGQWLPRYLRISQRMERLVGAAGVHTFRWTGEAITRDGLVHALGCGVGVGVYVGHGRPVGWVGYHGVRAHHLDPSARAHERSSAREPMGAILSLCCRTASRRRVGLSYAEALPLLGVAAASFGAVDDTLHADNTRWALGICGALAAGAASIGELIVRAEPASPRALASYRLIGDPLAPLGSDERSLRRARRVRTHG